MTDLLPPDVATYARREKANTIEAVQFDGTGDHAAQIIRWANASNISAMTRGEGAWEIVIRVNEDTMRAQAGDWLAKGALGQFYSLPDDIFQATYEMTPPGNDGVTR